MDTSTVAVANLKSNLSRYIGQVRAGGSVEITSHDKPVARLVGIPPAAPAGLADAVASGLVTWSGHKPTFGPPIRLSSGGTTLRQMVAEDRGA